MNLEEKIDRFENVSFVVLFSEHKKGGLFFICFDPLQDNKLTEIEPQAFSSLANLAHLDVTGNRMTKLEDIMMRYPSILKALYLDHNRLQTFHRETFSGQTSMDVLSMSDNKLERIPAGVFDELINLYRLSLANNRIGIIEDNALGGLHRVRDETILLP